MAALRIVAITGNAGAFPRLLAALHALERSRKDVQLWVQWGKAQPWSGLAGATLVPRDEMLAHIARADAVVTHAGCGSLLDAIALGHMPLAMARRACHDEHVNDHQLELLEELTQEGRVLPFDNADELKRHLNKAVARRGAAHNHCGAGLRTALKQELDSLSLISTKRRWALAALKLLSTPVSIHPNRHTAHCRID